MAAANPKGYEVLPFPKDYPVGNMPWLRIVPPSIYWGIRMVRDAVGKKDLPIFISENGCADGDDEQATRPDQPPPGSKKPKREIPPYLRVIK